MFFVIWIFGLGLRFVQEQEKEEDLKSRSVKDVEDVVQSREGWVIKLM